MNKFLRWSLMIFIIKGFRTAVFIFIVISITFRPICPPAFFRCLSNSGSFIELRTTSFIESTGIACSDSVSNNRVQVVSIPVLLLACRQDWTCNIEMVVSLEAKGTNAYNRYATCLAGLNTCTRLWVTESEQVTPVDSIKDVVRSSVEVPELNKHEQDEDNCPKTLNDKNQSFVYTQLNDQTVLFQTIQFNKSYLFPHSSNVKQSYLTHR